MELDITKFFHEACAMDYSASRAELGDSASADTWRAANDDSDDYMLLDTDDKRDKFRAHLKSMGFSEAGDTHTDTELNALLLQCIAGDIREAGLDVESPDWRQYVRDSNAGRVSGRISRNPDGTIYYYIGE